MSDARQHPGSVEEAIATELIRIHRETYGKGAGSANVVIDGDMVVVLLDDIELQHNEQFLVDAGEGASVIEVRTRYQQAIEATFRAVVERATGRRVVSFASTTKLDDPHYVVEIFRLAPLREDTRAALPPGL